MTEKDKPQATVAPPDAPETEQERQEAETLARLLEGGEGALPADVAETAALLRAHTKGGLSDDRREAVWTSFEKSLDGPKSERGAERGPRKWWRLWLITLPVMGAAGFLIFQTQQPSHAPVGLRSWEAPAPSATLLRQQINATKSPDGHRDLVAAMREYRKDWMRGLGQKPEGSP